MACSTAPPGPRTPPACADCCDQSRLDCVGFRPYLQLIKERGSMSSDKVVHVTDASFEQEVLKSPQPVLIDFWAPWCAPCRAIAPIIDDLAGEYSGRLKVVKMNVDDN